MTIAVTIDATRVIAKLENTSKRLGPNAQLALWNIARTTAKAIRQQYLMQAKNSSRQRHASRFMARRIDKNSIGVVMPRSAHMLDTSRPHYVSLKRGRRIVQWTRKYYGNIVKSGKSRVYKGPRGGITGGFIYSTPDPFVSKALLKVRNRYREIIRDALRKTTRSSTR
jgi:hypothetical protein